MRGFSSVAYTAVFNTPIMPNTGKNNSDNYNVSKFTISVQCLESYTEII
jgi:hypothetical protein